MKSFLRLTASSLLPSLALAAGLLVSGAAVAQDAPPAPAQASPFTDVTPVGDWSVRCLARPSPSPCEMYEEMDDKNSRQRVLGVSIAYIPGNDRHLMQVAVPLEVALGKGLVIQTDSFTSPMLHYRRCDQMGCYVEMLIDNGSVDSISHSGPNAAVKIVADNGKAFSLRLSLNGFASAHDKMVGLSKQKAKTPAPQPAAPAPAPAP
jgi:invasion protein IalB